MKRLIYISILLLSFVACDNKSVTSRLDDIDSLIIKNQYDSAYTHLNSVDKSELNTDEDIAHYWLLKTQTGYLVNKPDSSTKLDSLVIPYYINSGNRDKLAEAYYYSAYRNLISGNLPQAVALYKSAEEQATQSKDHRLQYKIATSLVYVNQQTGNCKLQLHYAQKSLAIAKDSQNKEWIASAFNSVAVAFSWIGEKDSAIIYMNRAMPYSQYIDTKNQPAFFNNMAIVYKHSQPETAKKYLQESLSMYEHSNTLQHLADIYYNEGNQEEAYRLWKRALIVDNGLERDRILHNILDYDVEHGNTDDVCKTVKEIVHIKDSMLNTLRNDTIKDLQLRFDHEVAMHEQEQITNNWQKGVLVVVIIVLLLLAYIVIMKILEKNRNQKMQMQMNDYMSQIRELEASGEDASDKVEELNKKIKKYLDYEAPELKIGKMHYDDIAENRIETLSQAGWNRNDERIFNNYVAAIDYRTVNRIKKVKRKEKLTTHRLFFLILVEMGKSDEYIAKLFGVNERSIETLRTRTKPIE